MRRKCRPKSLEETQRIWEQRLRKSGFVDIEDTTREGRPLKVWSSHFQRPEILAKMAARIKYDEQMSAFLNTSGINKICDFLSAHGNSSISPAKRLKIIELHAQGLDEREIAKRLRCGKKCVHLTLVKMREWMKVA